MRKETGGAVPERLVQDLKSFVAEFANETDRAAVILGAAKLDILLYQLLTKALLPNAGNTDDLFDGDAPLSTFNAKINLCYRLGLIDSGLTRALHLVRRIRNSFAHEITGKTLETGSHRDRIKELVAPFDKIESFASYKTTYFRGNNEAAASFRAVLAVMIARLHTAIENAGSLAAATPVGLIPPKWAKR